MAEEHRHLDPDTAKIRQRRGKEALARLDELDGYKVADYDEDIRGWDVFTPDGKKIGKVEELVVDTSVLKARYLEVKVDKDVLGAKDDRWVLVPVGAARLNDDDNEVVIERIPTDNLLTKEERKRKPLDRDAEVSLREQYTGSPRGGVADMPDADDDFYSHDIYDERRLRRGDRRERTEPYITRPEGSPDARLE
jgi:photosynthetic reaction center H subunit